MTKLNLFFTFIIFFIWAKAYGQGAPQIQWQKCYGGSLNDEAKTVIATSDGGYIIAGYTFSNNGDVSGNHSSGSDIWIIKIDAIGSILWQKCLGGTSNESANNVLSLQQDGFIIAGRASSVDGDVSGNHNHSDDFWVVRTDTVLNILWEHCYGGSDDDEALNIAILAPDKYIVFGNTNSIDGDVQQNPHGTATDYWIINLDTIGTLISQRAYGGGSYEFGANVSISSTYYLAGGSTDSPDFDITCSPVDDDIWIIELDSVGLIQNQFCFGGSSDEELGNLKHLNDSSFIMVGSTSSNDGDINGNHGLADMWIAKSNNIGIVEWQNCFGGFYQEQAFACDTTYDKGFIMAGRTNSNDSLVSSQGMDDFYIVKTDSIGNLQWGLSMGGSNDERASSIIQTSDSGFLVVGFTSSNNGNVNGNHGGKDFWVVKLSSPYVGVVNPISEITDLSVYQNPVSNTIEMSFYFSSKENVNLQLIDITGRILLQDGFTATNGINKHRIFTGDLSEGIYFVRLQADGGAVTKKVVIQ